jgi:hypothetical protein
MHVKAIAVAVIFFASCMSTTSFLNEHENLFKNEFLNHSLLNIRGGSVNLQIYKGNLRNSYFFDKAADGFKLVSDSLQFPITDIERYIGIDLNHKSIYSRQLEEIANQLYSKMRQANVNSFSSEFHELGIDLLIYMPHKRLVYIGDLSKINNPEWLKFIEQSRKIKEHWYLSQN